MNLDSIKRNLSNIPGWRTHRKIVVIESDDWGSVRMPSRKVYNVLKSKGIDLSSGDSLRYNLYDSLATSEDLAHLFEVLQEYKDVKGNHPVFTALSLVANPDFNKIKESGFSKYSFEPFTETLKHYTGCEKSLMLWKEGVLNKVFVPQFHGREHLNISVWIRALQKNHPHTRLAFEHGMWGYNDPTQNISYQAAFDLELPEDIDNQKEVIVNGLNIFEQIHGYKASYFVPTNGPFNSKLEESAFEQGIRYISTSKIHSEPLGNGKYQKKYYWLGKNNSYGQCYLTRNAFFEPSQNGKDWIDRCLNDVKLAFRWQKPAVISTHRVNYIGAIDPSNRSRGLKQLSELLKILLNTWPSIEFMTSSELGDQICLKHIN